MHVLLLYGAGDVIKMKKIELILTDNEAAIANDPVYIEAGEDVEFVITNPVGKLYFSTGSENYEIKDNKFAMSYNELKSIERLNIVIKTEDEVYPRLMPVIGLKIRDVMVVGDTIDEKYPEVVKALDERIKRLERAVLELYELIQEIKNEGVIE